MLAFLCAFLHNLRMSASTHTPPTICALATAPLPAGVGIIRLSGAAAKVAADVLCPTFNGVSPRVAHYGQLIIDGVVIDRALLLHFPAPHSFTGEDVVEIQGHGSLFVLDKILDFLCTQPNVRRAEAGEFSRRAVENNKMDLTQAEGLADLIAAATSAQAKQAMRQLEGELGDTFNGWRTEILHLLAHVEAAIDFPDEELDILADAALEEKVTAFLNNISTATRTNLGERLRDGFKLAIIGRPNAGKSTLTNLLTGQDTAIVTPEAGTTRDVVTAALTIGDFPVQLADTAGLRDATETIEKIGIERAGATAETADLIIALTSAEDWQTHNGPTSEVFPYLQPERTLLLISKVDETNLNVPNTWQKHDVLGVNLTSSDSLSGVLSALEKLITAAYAPAQEAATVTRARHRDALNNAHGALTRALDLYKNPRSDTSLAELLAQDLRDAAAAIGTITGHTSSEDVLDTVFSTFCVGK